MSEILAATETLIDAQAEAAKAGAQLEDVQRTETVATMATETAQALDVIEAEEDREESWEENLNALRLEMNSRLDSIQATLTETQRQLSSELLSSMTQIFQTAVAALAIQSNPEVSPTQTSPEPENVNVAATPESATVPDERTPTERPRPKTRKI